MCNKTPRSRPWKVWLTLLRPPNLFTVPGDPLVGVMLVVGTSSVAPRWPAVGAVLTAALLLYAAGLLANDYYDRFIDARERPHRPIPSGAVTPNTVLAVAIGLTMGGLILLFAYAGRVAFCAGLLVAFASWFYNAAGKRSASLAPFSMGLCRGLSLMMGACVVGFHGATSISVLVSATALTLFIALVTHLARHEAEASRPPTPAWAAWAVPLLLTAWLTAVLSRSAHPLSLAFILSAMALLWTIVWIVQLKPEAPPAQVQLAIGGLIRGLILTQAALCASCGPAGQALALLLLAAFPVSGWIGKWFYGS